MSAEARPRRRGSAYVKPTREYVEGLVSELQGIYSAQDEQIRTMRQVRELTRPVAIEPRLRLVTVEIRDPTATDEIARASASLSVNDPRCHVTPSRPSDKAQENATRREKGSEAILRVCGRRTPGVDTFSALVDHCVGDGGAWAKLVWQKDAWDERYKLRLSDYERSAWEEIQDEEKGRRLDEEEAEEDGEGDQDREEKVSARRRVLAEEAPEIKARRRAHKRFKSDAEEAKKEAGPPFVWTAVDPLSVYPVFAAGRLTEVVEVSERPQLATFRKYRLRRNQDGDIVPDELLQGTPAEEARNTTTIRFLEHWDARTVTYLVQGKNKRGESSGRVVDQWEHHYGQVPYFYGPGISMAHWRNRKVGWSIAEAKRWLVEYRSFLWTLHANVTSRDAFAPLQKKRPLGAAPAKGDPGVPRAESPHWGLREILETEPGGEYEPIRFPEVAQALKEQIALVSEAIERLESPRVTGEIGGGLEGAGFAINQVLAEARIRFDPIARSLERLYEEATRFLWQLIRKLVRETVWVYREGEDTGYLSLGPEDVADVVGLRWELDPERPSAKLIEARYWHERVKSGTGSLDQAIEAMGDNPDEVRLGRAMDRIRASEWYQKYQDMLVLQQVGKGDLMAFAQRAQFVAEQGGMPGGPGAPPAMGTALVPDMGNMALSPGGAGSNPVNGAVAGAGPGAVVPEMGATAGIQQLQG